MKEQLKELLEMQKLLDEAIMKEHRLTEYPVDNMKIALFVELGEMMNELPTIFKHWKKSAADDYDKALVEYVDALHFVLSLFNYRNCKLDFVLDYKSYASKNACGSLTLFDYLRDLISACCCNGYKTLGIMFKLGNVFGFSWDEIYTTYKKKNALNYERLKKGY